LLIFVLLHKFASRFSSPSSLFSAQEVFDANTENITLRIMPANGDKLATVEEKVRVWENCAGAMPAREAKSAIQPQRL
jgi:hypothetical protein